VFIEGPNAPMQMIKGKNMDKQLNIVIAPFYTLGLLTDIVQVTITSLLPLEPLTMVWSRYTGYVTPKEHLDCPTKKSKT
jgi:thiamine biosynthesis protein ThiC